MNSFSREPQRHEHPEPDEVSEQAIHVCHIGARDGYVPIDFPSAFDKSVEFTLFDGADDSIPPTVTLLSGRVTSSHSSSASSLFWSTQEPKTFFSTTCPYAASLKQLRPEYRDWFVFGNGHCDYVLGQAHAVKHSTEVSTTTLDAAFSPGSLISHKSPNVITIDAQGASLEILLGAERTLSRSTIAVVCETELLGFFDPVPSFSGILKLLTANGFVFCGFIPESSPWASPGRAPIGMRGNPLAGSQDAIFLKRPTAIPESSQAVLLPKLVATATFFGFLDCAVEAAELFCSRDHDMQKLASSSCSISAFTSDLVTHWRSRSKLFPPSFAERDTASRLLRTHKKLAQAMSAGHRMDAWLWRQISNAEFAVRQWISPRSKIHLDYPIFGASRLEKLLIKWGFQDLKETIQAQRLRQQLHAAEIKK